MFKRKSLTVWAGWEKHPGEHPSSFSASQNGNSSQLLCGHMMYRAGVSDSQRGPSEHTSPASLTSIKANILRPCELSATWRFLPEEWWQQQKAEKSVTCVCVCTCASSRCDFSPPRSEHLNEIHFSHGECRTHFLHANTARATGTATRDSAEAHEAKVVSGSQDANGSFGRSTVTARKLRLCSCRAHSHGCCKTLAPGLIKTLIIWASGPNGSLMGSLMLLWACRKRHSLAEEEEEATGTASGGQKQKAV